MYVVVMRDGGVSGQAFMLSASYIASCCCRNWRGRLNKKLVVGVSICTTPIRLATEV